MRRAVTIAESQWPEMADANMEVPLDSFTDEEVAAKEPTLRETSTGRSGLRFVRRSTPPRWLDRRGHRNRRSCRP
jgi:hypothetical protein